MVNSETANSSDKRSMPAAGLGSVQDWLPHRYPMLLVDRVLDYRENEYIRAIKVVSGLDPFLQGHFPGNPVMPGVLIVEAMAQASGILGRLTFPDRKNTCLLTEIGETRFRRQVIPGDVLELHIIVEKQRKDFFWFNGTAKVCGELAASCVFTAKLS